MSRPGIEPGPPEREASTLEKSHSLIAGYSEPLLELRLVQRVASTVHLFGEKGRGASPRSKTVGR